MSTAFGPAQRFSPAPSRHDSWVVRRVAARIQAGLQQASTAGPLAGVCVIPVDDRGVFSPTAADMVVSATTPCLAGPGIKANSFGEFASDRFLSAVVESVDARTAELDVRCPCCGALHQTRWSLAALWQFIPRREHDYLRLYLGHGHHAYRTWDPRTADTEVIECGGSIDVAPTGRRGLEMIVRRAAVPDAGTAMSSAVFFDLPPLQQMAVVYREFEAVFAARASVV